MFKDKRYKTVKLLIERGGISLFSEIFDHIPVTTIAKFLGSNHVRLTAYIDDPKLLTFDKVLSLAEYFEVTEEKMIELTHKQIIENRKKKKRGMK